MTTEEAVARLEVSAKYDAELLQEEVEAIRTVLAALDEQTKRMERLEAVAEAARIICRSWDFDGLKAALARLDGAEGGATP